MATSKDFRVKNGLVVEQDISFGGSFKDLNGNPISLGGGDSLITEVPLTSYKDIGLPTSVTYTPQTTISVNSGFDFGVGSNRASNYDYICIKDMYPGWSQWNRDVGYNDVPLPLGGKHVILIGRDNAAGNPFSTSAIYTDLLNAEVGDTLTFKFRMENTNYQLDTYTVSTKIVYKPWVWPTNNLGLGYDGFYDRVTGGTIHTSGEFIALAFEWILWDSVGVGETYGLPPSSNWYRASGNNGTQWYSSASQYYGDAGYNSSTYYLNTTKLFNDGNGAYNNGYGTIGFVSSGILAPAHTNFVVTPTIANKININGNTIYGGTTDPLTKYELSSVSSTEFKISSIDATNNISTSKQLKVYSGLDKEQILKIGNTITGYEFPENNKLLIDGQLSKVIDYTNYGSVLSAVANPDTVGSYVSTFQKVGYYPGAWNNNINYVNHNSGSNLIHADYSTNMSYGSGWDSTDHGITVFKLSNSIYDNLKLADTVTLSYANYNGSAIVLTCKVDSYATTGFKYYGSGGNIYYADTNWIKLTPISGTRNGTEQLTTFTGDPTQGTGVFNYYYDLMNDVFSTGLNNYTVGYTIKTINGVCSNQLTGLSDKDVVTINNIQATVSNISGANFTFTAGSNYSVSDYIGYNIISSSHEDYATINDISRNLPSWIPALDASTSKTGDRYTITSSATGPVWRQLTLDDVVINGNGVNGIIVAQNGQDAQFNSLGTDVDTNYGAMRIVSGGFTVKKKLAANNIETLKVIARTSISTDSISAYSGSDLTIPVLGGLSVTKDIKITGGGAKTGDSLYNNVPFMLMPDAGGASIINSGVAGTLSTSGDVQLSSLVPPGGSGKSVMIGNSSSNYISVTNPNAFNIGTGDWTIEFWSAVSSNSGTISGGFYDRVNFLSAGSSYSDTSKFYARFDWPVYMYLTINGSQSSSGAQQWLGGYNSGLKWNHLALTRSGNTIRYFNNGVLEASFTHSTTTDTSANNFYLRGMSYYQFFYNYRVTVGTARYVSNFTPTVTPYTNSVSDIPPTILNDGLNIEAGVKLRNVNSAPVDNYSNGGYMYVEGGALKYRGSNGTVTTIGAA